MNVLRRTAGALHREHARRERGKRLPAYAEALRRGCGIPRPWTAMPEDKEKFAMNNVFKFLLATVVVGVPLFSASAASAGTGQNVGMGTGQHGRRWVAGHETDKGQGGRVRPAGPSRNVDRHVTPRTESHSSDVPISAGKYGTTQDGGKHDAGQDGGGKYSSGQDSGKYGAGQDSGKYGSGQDSGKYGAGQDSGTYGEYPEDSADKYGDMGDSSETYDDYPEDSGGAYGDMEDSGGKYGDYPGDSGGMYGEYPEDSADTYDDKYDSRVFR